MSRVLVVEDDVANMKLVCEILSLGGYEALTAEDGETALAIAKRELPDLILMDIQLPGQDGVEVTRQLRKCHETISIPIIALTAHAMSGDEKRILDSGCNRYLAKPLNYKELLKTIKELLKVS
jgi:two-component system, cell cycle response regulator DivK